MKCTVQFLNNVLAVQIKSETNVLFFSREASTTAVSLGTALKVRMKKAAFLKFYDLSSTDRRKV